MSTAIPAFENLGEAPEKGDAVLMLASNFCIPVRNRERAWSVDSIGGWSTTAETPAPLSFAPMGPSVSLRRPWEEQTDSRCIPMPAPEEWLSPRFIFAPTAEAAIEKYHASEACPWGALELQRRGSWLEFARKWSGPSGGDVPVITFSHQMASLAKEGMWENELLAIHALLAEVIAYQSAERSGVRNSRIHKALFNNEQKPLAPKPEAVR